MSNRYNIDRFFTQAYPPLETHFKALANVQNPSTLFVTCSDSRVDPSLITQTLPGELFVLRNVGNLIPEYSSDPGSAAVVSYAVEVLKVERIVVCGHSNCGAMAGLLDPSSLTELPQVAGWLEHAASVRDKLKSETHEERWVDAIRANVSLQIENLLTHPYVAKAMSQGALAIEGWVYNIGEGQIESLVEIDFRTEVTIDTQGAPS